MKKLFFLSLVLAFVGCSTASKKTATDFDAYLEEAYQETLALYRLP